MDDPRAEDDFYLDQLARAAYVEKDWFDLILKSGAARPGRFAFAPFDLTELYDGYHQRFTELLAHASIDLAPRRALEIGSSTGRMFYEICRRWPALEHATLVEPSKNLRDAYALIFDGPASAPYVPVFKGLGQVAEVRLDTTTIRAAVAHVDRRVIGQPFADVPDDLGQFDLVVCANVIDQCHEPLRLVDLAIRSTAPGGRVAISCTYQWQCKYRGLPTRPIRHLDELFPEPWRLVAEGNLPFQLRVNERHWMRFLSHVCVFERRR